jgi:hypothetical protein
MAAAAPALLPSSALPSHQNRDRDQRRHGREADRNGEDVEPRHADSSAIPSRSASGLPAFDALAAAVRPSLAWSWGRLWAGPAASATAPAALRLPPNCRDVTAEHLGTVIAIVGAPKPPKDKPK